MPPSKMAAIGPFILGLVNFSYFSLAAAARLLLCWSAAAGRASPPRLCSLKFSSTNLVSAFRSSPLLSCSSPVAVPSPPLLLSGHPPFSGSAGVSYGSISGNPEVLGMPAEDIAATRIQTAFRAFMARKTLRRLKGMMPSHTLTGAIFPSPSETLGVHRKTELPVSSLQNRYPSAGNIEVQQARFASSVPSNEYGMVGIGNPGASQVMGRSRNIVHPSVHVQPEPPVQCRHGADHAGQERTQMPRMPAQFQQEARTGTRFSYALVAEQLRAAAMEQRRGDLTGRTGLAAEQLGGTPWSSLRAESRAENWQAPGIMRGSLTGQADSAAAISQFMLQPPTSLTSTLESRLPPFWRFPGTGNDQNGMYSQAAAQGIMKSIIYSKSDMQ